MLLQFGATGDRPLSEGLIDTRSTWLKPYVVAGLGCIIAGGLLAAATAYVTTQKTAWATAYIVLVGGIAQIGLGAAVAWLAPAAPRRLAWWAFIGWNLGNALVLAGQLAGVLLITDLGTIVLIAALVIVLVAVGTWGHRGSRGGGSEGIRSAHPGVLWAFRGLILLLAVTMPIGVVLAHLGD
ncbi:MAG: hypothetical protein ABI382_07290 [Nakamurella sp.]